MDTTSPFDFLSSDPAGGGGVALSPIMDASQNPSNGIDVTSMFNNLLGAAGNAYVASQNSATAQAISQAQIASIQQARGSPLAIFTTTNGKTLLWVGAGILALALILRK